MFRFTLLFILSLASSISLAAEPDWTLIQSPVSDDFNGISSSPQGKLRVAVGKGGKIVHFHQASPSGVVMPSGTTNDLFDVYVLSVDFAVASGRDIILLWDGSVWSPIITDSGLYLPVWATPDQSTIIYNIVDESGGFTPFHLRCAWDVAKAERSPFCQAGALDIGFCGSSDDIKIVKQSGDIDAIKNDLSPLNGQAGTIFEQPIDRNLTAVYIPSAGCLPGPYPPWDIFAVDSFKDIYNYQPENFQVTGGWNKTHSGQAEKQLLWIDGVALDWVAVGAQPSADINDPNNAPYSLVFDGNSITENTSFAPEVRGMTDVTTDFHFEHRIFSDSAEDEPGFCTDQSNPLCTPEPTGCSESSPGECFSASASTEAGGVAEFNLKSPPVVDVYLGTSIINWDILDPTIVDLVGYSIVVGNFGPDIATGVTLTMVADGNETVKNIACPDFTHTSADVVHKFSLNTPLAPGETKTCEFAQTTETVVDHVGTRRSGGIYTHVFSNEADRDFRNQSTACDITTGTCTRIALPSQ